MRRGVSVSSSQKSQTQVFIEGGKDSSDLGERGGGGGGGRDEWEFVGRSSREKSAQFQAGEGEPPLQIGVS